MRFNSSEGTISWFKDRYMDGTLTIRPSYQRNAVWMERQKAYLVETVLKGLPIPEVFIHTTVDEDGKSEYGVVDGQQRISALLQFIGTDFGDDADDYDAFTLSKIETDSAWYGKAFKDLTPEQRADFYSYKLSIRYLESINEDEIKEMFRRLNKFTSPLKPAELRNATYAGPFALLASKLADDNADYLAENRIITAQSIRRMADVEYLAELLIGVLNGPQGGGAADIDSYYVSFEDFEDEFPGEREAKKLLRSTFAKIDSLLPNIVSTRWSNKSDFYSLFLVLSEMQKHGIWDAGKEDLCARALQSFGTEVSEYLSDEEIKASESVRSYARAVGKGANEKSRRAARHVALRNFLDSELQGS